MRLVIWSAGAMLAALPTLTHGQDRARALGTASASAPAQSHYDDDNTEDDDDDIVVTGAKPAGAVIGNVAPEQRLNAGDVRAYGVDSIGDLITQLTPETQSARGSGRPTVLLNGQRISSLHEIHDLPTEAILRVEIFPEQVALSYGFAADQKVINIVLRKHFRSVTLSAERKMATEGGTASPHGKLGLVRISPTGRFNVNVDYTQTSRLTESERVLTSRASGGFYDLVGNITPGSAAATIADLSALAGEAVTVAGVPNATPSLRDFAATANSANTSDLSQYRTLIPASREFSSNLVYARQILGNVTATFNAQLDYSDKQADLGLPGVTLTIPRGNPYSPFDESVTLSRYVNLGIPLQQSQETLATHLGTTLTGGFTGWNWTVTGNYDRSVSKTFTTRAVDTRALQSAIDALDPGVNPFGLLGVPLVEPGQANYAKTLSTSGELNTLLTGSPFTLPAGKVLTSWNANVATSDFASRSIRSAVVQNSAIARDTAEGRLTVMLPIADRRRHVLAPLGELGANFNLATKRYSDFGTLTTLGYGARWSPFDKMHASVSWTDERDAPGAGQLGNPVIVTPGQRVFDYVTATSVDITQISGGNPGLAASRQRVFEAEINLRPVSNPDVRLNATYTATRSHNGIANLPAATAAIEAAFPDRFVRDAAGALISIDARPINLLAQSQRSLRIGVNFTQRIKSNRQKQIEAFRAATGPSPFARHPDARSAHPAGQGNAASPPPSAQQNQGLSDTGASVPGDAGAADAEPAHGADGFTHVGNGHHGGRRGFGGRGSRTGGRVMVALYHTWKLQDTVRIRDGLPLLDLLHGDTLGTGGEPRHEIEGRLGYFNKGLGAMLRVNWQSGTHVNGGTPVASEPLSFSSLATLNLRVFADLGSMAGVAEHHHWARGMRVSLSADNLFNSRQRVRDATGQIPISYQPDYLDPLGRTINLNIRKLFYERSAH